MNKINTLLKKMESFDINKTLNKVISTPDNELFIEDEIRERLNEKGTDAEGKQLSTFKAMSPNVYSLKTIAIKEAKGQPTNMVTLHDTGEFHDSFKVKTASNSFSITGSEKKKDGNISDNVDLTKVMDLSDEEKSNVAQYLKPDLISETRKQIQV